MTDLKVSVWANGDCVCRDRSTDAAITFITAYPVDTKFKVAIGDDTRVDLSKVDALAFIDDAEFPPPR